MFLFLLSAPSLAQEPAELTPEAQVTRAEATLKAARASLEDAETPDTLATLSERAQSAKDDANAAAKALQPQLAQLTEQLVPLGEVAEGSTEAREVAVQRTSLTKQRNAVDGTIKRAELAVVNANQLTADIEKLRASQFSEELGRKVASPLSPALWAQVAATAPTDTTRVLALYRLGTGAVRDAVKRKGWGLPLLGLGVALVLFFPVRLWLRALGRRYAAAEHAPKGRLRRTGLAVWLLVVGTLLPGLAAWALVSAMDAVGAIPPRLQTLSNYFLGATCFSAFIVALSSCLLAPKRPSWRLLELDDRAAGNLRKYAWSAAVVSWVSIMLAAVDRAARTSEINTIALDGVIALIYLCLIMAMLVTLSRLHRRQTAEAAERAEAQAADSRARGPAQRSGWIVLTRVAGNVVVVAAIIASLLGYLNFAKFVTSQLVWGGIVALTTSLLLKFADDLCTWMLHPDSRVGRTVVLTTGLSAAQVEQAGVLLSAFSRIALVLMALLIFTAPFGNLGSVMGSVEALSNGIPIGPNIRLQPGKILLAVVVLLAGLALMQALQRWLVDT